MDCKRTWVLGTCLLVSLTATRSGQAEQNGDLQARLERAEARIAELESRQTQTWLSQKRAEEANALIQEVLADAEARSSHLEDGVAGHDEQHFYLSSDDGSLLLQMGGQIQFRHILNLLDTDDDSGSDGLDEHEIGFELARSKLWFAGHIGQPQIRYRLRVAINRNDNDLRMQEAVLTYDLTDGMTIWAGETKTPFLREELIDSSRQLAVERSLVNEVFTMGYVQGIGVDWFLDAGSSNMLRWRASINDGIRSGEADFNTDAGLHSEDGDRNEKIFDNDNSDFAWTGRADVRLMGDWGQGDDFTAWSDEETSVLVGAALHWEWAETGDLSPNNEFITWTVDGSVECNGANLYAAVVQSHDENNEVGVDPTHTGVVVQGGYQILPDELEPFVRYEYMHLGTHVIDEGEDISLVTFGLNWYLNSHNAKVTTDVVWALDSLPTSGVLGINGNNQTLLGLLTDHPDEEDQIVWRAQLQLLF